MTAKQTINHMSLTDQIADYIVMEIARGRLSPGAKIVEREICDNLEVSRVPVREAMRLLQAQGVLRAKPNRGVFVGVLSLQATLEMLEVRETVERIAIRSILSEADRAAGARQALTECIEDLRKQALLKDLAGYCRADLNFHQTIIDLSASSILKSLWEAISKNVFVFLLNERSGAFDFDESIEDHNRLIRAIFDDPEALPDELKRHLIGHIQENYPEL